MTTRSIHAHPSRRPLAARLMRRPARVRKIVGSFYLSMGGVHLGIVAADPTLYRHFADGALFPIVRVGWSGIFMAEPATSGLVMAAGETALGVMLLVGGRWTKVGWVGVIGFHVALMLFGWAYWLWSVPALSYLVPAAVADWRRLS